MKITDLILKLYCIYCSKLVFFLFTVSRKSDLHNFVVKEDCVMLLCPRKVVDAVLKNRNSHASEEPLKTEIENIITGNSMPSLDNQKNGIKSESTFLSPPIEKHPSENDQTLQKA